MIKTWHRALHFATEAHYGQTRWNGVTPYIEHPKRVVEILKSWKVTDETLLVVGLLHDIIEDTNVTRHEIELEFGSVIADLVQELTRHNEDYLEHCRRMSKMASLVKLADIFANLTDTDSKKTTRFIHKRLDAIAILNENIHCQATAK